MEFSFSKKARRKRKSKRGKMFVSRLLNLITSADASSILMALVIGLVILLYSKIIWQNRWLYYHSFNMDGPSPTWPIIGNALYFKGGTADILVTLVKLCSEFKSPFRLWGNHQLIVGITKPKQIEAVLSKSVGKNEHYKFLKPVVGDGLLTGPVPIWKQHRKLISPLYNQKILNGFVKIFAEQSEILVEQARKLVGKGTVNVEKLLNSCAIDIVFETVYGDNLHTQTNDHYLESYMNRSSEIVFQRAFQIWYHPDFIFNLTPLKRELDQYVNEIKRIINVMIDKKRSKLIRQTENNGSEKSPIFLDYIIERNTTEQIWTEKEIMDESITLLFAGVETVMSAEGFALMLLGMHPDVQEKVYKEQQEIFGNSNRPVTPEDLRQMNYLERVIKETLRLYPGGSFITRDIDQDIQLENHIIPKGSSCIMGIYHMHMNPEFWQEPEKFNPDRFLPEESAKRHPFSYLPFAGGARDCIGRRFGMMAVKSVVSTFLRSYKVKTPYKKPADIKIRQDVVLKAVKGYLIELELRN